MQQFKRNRKNLWVLAAITLVSLALFATTGKTNNFGWMGVHDISTISVFESGIPIFRPWVAVEKFEVWMTGGHWYAENVGYALYAAWTLYFLYTTSADRNADKKFYLLFVPLSIIMYFGAWGGPIYDIVFALAMVKSIHYISLPKKNLITKDMIYAAIWLAVLDLSRPYALILSAGFILLWILKVNVKAVLLVVIFLSLAAPFHIFQYKKSLLSGRF